jgi:plasmid maintenance system antidote protein VapI
MNLPLKAAIILRFGDQNRAAKALGLHKSHISRLIRRRAQATERDRRFFSRVFGKRRARELLGMEKTGS